MTSLSNCTVMAPTSYTDPIQPMDVEFKPKDPVGSPTSKVCQEAISRIPLSPYSPSRREKRSMLEALGSPDRNKLARQLQDASLSSPPRPALRSTVAVARCLFQEPLPASVLTEKVFTDELSKWSNILSSRIPKVLGTMDRKSVTAKFFQKLYKIKTDNSQDQKYNINLASGFFLNFLIKNTSFDDDFFESLSNLKFNDSDIQKLYDDLLARKEIGAIFHVLALFVEKDFFLKNVHIDEKLDVQAFFSKINQSSFTPWLFFEKDKDIIQYFLEKNDLNSLKKYLNIFIKKDNGFLNEMLETVYNFIINFSFHYGASQISLGNVYSSSKTDLKTEMEKLLSKEPDNLDSRNKEPDNLDSRNKEPDNLGSRNIVKYWRKKLSKLNLIIDDEHIFSAVPSGKVFKGFHFAPLDKSEIDFESSKAKGIAVEKYPRVESPNGICLRTFEVEASLKSKQRFLETVKATKTSTTSPYKSPNEELLAIQFATKNPINKPDFWTAAGQKKILSLIQANNCQRYATITWFMQEQNMVRSSYPIIFFEERNAFSDALSRRVLPQLSIKTKKNTLDSHPLSVNISPQRKLIEMLNVIIGPFERSITLSGTKTDRLEQLKKKVPFLIDLINQTKTFEIVPADEIVILKTSFQKCGKSLADFIIEAIRDLPDDEKAECLSEEKIRESFRDFAEGEIYFTYPSWEHIFKLMGLID